MADIINPEAVRYCNEVIRPLANVATQYYYDTVKAANEWAATDMGTKIPATADIVIDGSATDGRSQITGSMVNNLINHVAAMQTDLEANTNQKLNILLQIETTSS